LASRKAEKERLRQERLARERELAAAARRRRMLWLYGLAVIAVAAAAIVVVFVVTGGTSNNSSNASAGTGTKPNLQTVSLKTLRDVHPAPSPGSLGPEGIPLPKAPPLASNASSNTGATVDAIQCNTSEQTIFHVHTHLTVFVNGHPRQIPYGIGIAPPRQVSQTSRGPFVEAGTCFYWLHTHAADGIIHIESPSATHVFTLGDFFAEWRQPLSATQVGPAKGPVTAFFNGKPWTQNPAAIPLGAHFVIQLDVGQPVVPYHAVSFGAQGL